MEKFDLAEDPAEILFKIDLIDDKFYCSASYCQKFGVDIDGVKFSSYFIAEERIHPDDLLTLDEFYDNILSGVANGSCEVRIADANGRYIWCRIDYEVVQDSAGHVASGKIIDIHEHKLKEEQWRYYVNNDAPSGLLTIAAATEKFDQYLQYEGRFCKSALLYIAIDGQVDYDESCFIEGLTAKLKVAFAKDSIIGRDSGNGNFVVFSCNIASTEYINAALVRIEHWLHNNYDGSLKLVSAIGVFPKDGENAAALLERVWSEISPSR